MSGLKPPSLADFYRSLHARGVTTGDLAARIGVARPTVTRVINGLRRRGPVWAKVARELTAAEIALLDVAQCHPWNKARVAKRPRWNPLAVQLNGRAA